MKTIELPASKSLSARALIINALAEKPCALHNLSDCDDTKAMLQGLENHDIVDIGPAGTAMRFLTAYFAVQPQREVLLTGSERMLQRPIRILVEALKNLGADVEYAGEEGFPPLKIRGRKLAGGEVTLSASVSSQYISALMMIAPTLKNGLTLHLEGAVASRPYIEMTRGLMKEWGVTTEWKGNSIVIPAQEYRRERDFEVEGDWSAASYLYEISSVMGDGISVKDLSIRSLQGDARIAGLFEKLGVKTEETSDGLLLSSCPMPSVSLLEIDFSDIPDMAQTFVVTSCLKGVPFHFTGLKSLKIKETDRIAALIAECGKLGWELVEPADGELSWDGTTHAATSLSIATYHDHRMAMSFAPAKVKYPELKIENPEVVSKSFPNFWEVFAEFNL